MQELSVTSPIRLEVASNRQSSTPINSNDEQQANFYSKSYNTFSVSNLANSSETSHQTRDWRQSPLISNNKPIHEHSNDQYSKIFSNNEVGNTAIFSTIYD